MTVGVRRFDAVLFDVGGVLTTSLGPIMAAKVGAAGMSFLDFLPFGLGPLETDTDHPFHRLERGEITLDAAESAIRLSLVAAGFTTPMSFPSKEEMFSGLHAVPEMLDLVAEVRAAGYATAIVSNCIEAWDGWSGVLDSDALVDVVIDSCRVGLRKPDRRIYELAMDRLEVVPERKLFIDDFLWNIPAAQDLGITTVHCTDHTVAVSELRELLRLG